MQQFQQRMDVIGNNIANVNTMGYKSARSEIAESFSQTLRTATAGSATSTSIPGVQVGLGATTSTVRTLFTPGAIEQTDVATDLAISGEGFFIVKELGTNALFATRDGSFRLDNQGYLVTQSGLRLQGFSDAALTTRGDLRIDETGAPASATPGAKVESFSIGEDGRVTVTLSDKTIFDRGQVLLQKFTDPQSLVKSGKNLYSSIAEAGPLGGAGTPTSERPGSNGLGKIQSAALELSNVNLANEFTDMITAQRAFQANSRTITTSDEMLQELVNLKR